MNITHNSSSSESQEMLSSLQQAVANALDKKWRLGQYAVISVDNQPVIIEGEALKIMAEKGTWWCLQPFLDDEDATPFPEGSPNRKKQLQMMDGTDNAYKLAKKYNIKTAFGTDCLFDPKIAARQGPQLTKLLRWYTAFEVLKMATSTNGALLALSGPRNPYPNKLGVIEEGAYADMILVDGNAIQNIKLIEDPEKNFLLIMKDGIIYKNTIK